MIKGPVKGPLFILVAGDCYAEIGDLASAEILLQKIA